MAVRLESGNMDLFGTVKKRDCEANKKISYSQRSPVSTKASTSKTVFNSGGHSFHVDYGEIIESGLFERVTRDCGGQELRRTPVRRFRKVGSDEWYSCPAAFGNDQWNNNFVPADSNDAIKQARINQEKAGSSEVDEMVEASGNIPVDEEGNEIGERVEQPEPVLNKPVQSKTSDNSKLLAGLVLIGGVFIAYKLLK